VFRKSTNHSVWLHSISFGLVWFGLVSFHFICVDWVGVRGGRLYSGKEDKERGWWGDTGSK